MGKACRSKNVIYLIHVADTESEGFHKSGNVNQHKTDKERQYEDVSHGVSFGRQIHHSFFLRKLEGCLTAVSDDT